MSVNEEKSAILTGLITHYGEGLDGSAPTRAVWEHLLARSENPLTLINLFKLKDTLLTKSGDTITGQDAFNQYAAVSMPTMQAVGGSFLHIGQSEAMFCGDKEDWDLIVVGAYPNTKALFDLVTNADYISAYKHRVAAVEKQKVYISGNRA